MSARTELTYFSRLLAKLGVGVEVIKHGSHKSAGEMYTRTGPSDEARQSMEALLEDSYRICWDRRKQLCYSGSFRYRKENGYSDTRNNN